MSWFSSGLKAIGNAVAPVAHVLGQGASLVGKGVGLIPGVGQVAGGVLGTAGGLLQGHNIGDSLREGAGNATYGLSNLIPGMEQGHNQRISDQNAYNDAQAKSIGSAAGGADPVNAADRTGAADTTQTGAGTLPRRTAATPGAYTPPWATARQGGNPAWQSRPAMPLGAPGAGGGGSFINGSGNPPPPQLAGAPPMMPPMPGQEGNGQATNGQGMGFRQMPRSRLSVGANRSGYAVADGQPGQQGAGTAGTAGGLTNDTITPGSSVDAIDPTNSLRDKTVAPGTGPDRVQMLKTALADYDTEDQKRRTLGQQAIGQKAAAFGRIGAGMTTNDLTGLERSEEQDRERYKNELLNDATNRNVEDQRANREELRGERGYTNSLEQQAFDRRRGETFDQEALANGEFNRNAARLSLGSSGNPADYYLGAAKGASASANQGAATTADLLMQHGADSANSAVVQDLLRKRGIIPPSNIPGTTVPDPMYPASGGGYS